MRHPRPPTFDHTFFASTCQRPLPDSFFADRSLQWLAAWRGLGRQGWEKKGDVVPGMLSACCRSLRARTFKVFSPHNFINTRFSVLHIARPSLGRASCRGWQVPSVLRGDGSGHLVVRGRHVHSAVQHPLLHLNPVFLFLRRHSVACLLPLM